MEPYSIRCTTCRAKLKVRKPEAVGQIVSCPRCGSMVMVHPQSPQSDGHDESADNATPNGDARPDRASRTSGGKLPAGHLDGSTYDSVNALLDDDGAHRRDTKLAASAVTATLASKSRASRPNPSHAQGTMATTRNMSGLRIFGRAALLAIAMGVGAAIATGSYYLSKRAPLGGELETLSPAEVVDSPPLNGTDQTEHEGTQAEGTASEPVVDVPESSASSATLEQSSALPLELNPTPIVPSSPAVQVQTTQLDESGSRAISAGHRDG